MPRAIAAALAAILGVFAGQAHAVECSKVQYQGNRYTLCEVDPAQDDMRLFLRDESGMIYGNFAAIDADLARDGLQLSFAMNGGMYHEDRAPVGHYVEDGVQVMRVVPNAGPGNFGLLPNGVLCFGDGSAHVIETLRFVEESPSCAYASQSGPMLVIDGALHPAFLPDSTSRFIRNGVGTTEAGDRAIFVVSDNSVTFHDFASFFRDHLRLKQALFIDGRVSRLHAPQLGRSDLGRPMGPIVGVVVPAGSLN
ncbi:phosphodiester glycosidase family protein [Pseudoprimorskyibacter insulae]|uniref:Phosphodiester glycosidase domain-containing protein n=1 Tax=Pseudoprimorskyibacter insulae TaxID=1695997 RepID=A0A2R8AVF4_9RHOB|nr:phosphodiester glycosidase family protein [Pseudoprimorskyibacter insulae]SPF80005.1 hypothetical protein PRI8871_01807 [Pseudoprimorskyibacter insulae]